MSLELGVSNDCFPDPSKCHNCEWKKNASLKKESYPKDNLKRCANCHLMTYCDKDCQKEHWLKVHNKHCKYLSGKSPVKDSHHDAATCPRCIQEREASRPQILSKNSVKTTCNVQVVARSMKKELGKTFGFHEQGKKCSCSLEHGLQLPFPLGEVSGQYLETAGTGLDPMLAHAFSIVKAMIDKAKDGKPSTALFELLRAIIRVRAQQWNDVLVSGYHIFRDGRALSDLADQVYSLRTIYSSETCVDPWFKILTFLVRVIRKITDAADINMIYDSDSLEDPRFKTLKQNLVYCQTQVCEKKMWSHFMPWPQMVNGSLAFVLPPGTRCESCHAPLLGEAAMFTEDADTLPLLYPYVGDNGAIVACCSPVLKSSCWVDYENKNFDIQLRENDDLSQKLVEETTLFGTQSRDCDLCLKSSLKSQRCSACLSVQYCSLACQRKDLDFHKTVCDTWAKDNSRKILSGREQKKYWKKVLK